MPGCGEHSSKNRASTQPAVKVRLGRSQQSPSALAAVAVREGLFARQGILLQDVPHVSGQRAMEALLAGEVDAVTAADVPVVIAAFDRNDFRIVATIATSTGGLERIVARKDRGIAAIADLKGRRIATQRGSVVHFFLHVLLSKNGMTDQDVQVVFLKAEDLPGALAAGQVDAICMREPYVSKARALLGANATVLSDPQVKLLRTEHLVVSRRLLRESPGAVRAMLAALIQAERAARQDGQAALRAVADDLAMDTPGRQAAGDELKTLELRVALDQFLLVHLESIADWAAAAGLTRNMTPPDSLELVDTSPLESLDPSAVTIIR